MRDRATVALTILEGEESASTDFLLQGISMSFANLECAVRQFDVQGGVNDSAPLTFAVRIECELKRMSKTRTCCLWPLTRGSLPPPCTSDSSRFLGSKRRCRCQANKRLHPAPPRSPIAGRLVQQTPPLHDLSRPARRCLRCPSLLLSAVFSARPLL